MVKIKSIAVVFDKPVFAAGEAVSGKVQLDVVKTVRIRKVTLFCHGRCKIKWTEGEDSLKYKEDYFDNWMDIYDPGEEQFIDRGVYSFEFSFPLSPNIPSSFQGEYGYVTYYCAVKVEKNGFSSMILDNDTTGEFRVVRHLDLNLEPEGIKCAMEGKETSEVDCCCCRSGDVYAEFNINKQGFIPGEYLIINALVKNRSNSQVHSTRVSLEQHVTFYAYGAQGLFSSSRTPKPKHTRNYIYFVKHGLIRSGQTDTWDAFPIQIPNLPPTRLTGCTFIDIAYTVNFKVSMPQGGDTIKMGCAITIGTIPLRDESTIAQPVSLNAITTQPMTQTMQPVHAVSNQSSPSAPPAYAEDVDPDTWKLPPPSYEECISGMGPITNYAI